MDNAGQGEPREAGEEVADRHITVALRVLRALGDGHEPYAPSVLPVAREVARLLADPSLVLPAAEALLSPVMGWRQLCFNQRGSTNGVTANKAVQFWQYAGDGTNVIEADTLAEAYEKLKAKQPRHAG